MFSKKITWPKQACRRCGQRIQIVRGRLGWLPYDIHPQVPHRCGDPLDHCIAAQNLSGKGTLRAIGNDQPRH